MSHNLLVCVVLLVVCAVAMRLMRPAEETVDLAQLQRPSISGIRPGMLLDDIKRLHPGWTPDSDASVTGFDVWYLRHGDVTDILGLELYDGNRRIVGNGDPLSRLADLDRHLIGRSTAVYENASFVVTVHIEGERILGVGVGDRTRPIYIGAYPKNPPVHLHQPWDRTDIRN